MHEANTSTLKQKDVASNGRNWKIGIRRKRVVASVGNGFSKFDIMSLFSYFLSVFQLAAVSLVSMDTSEKMTVLSVCLKCHLE